MTDRQVNIEGNDIFISSGHTIKNLEIIHVFKFEEQRPTIKVYDSSLLKRTFSIETLTNNPDLTGQFFHSSIRVLTNSAVMIDGIISKDSIKFSSWQDKDYEAIRLQPFFLSDREHENEKLKGKGLFRRGLHFSGTVTPSGVRVICICDNCGKSFSLQHFHAGFSEAQYFYSTDGKQTLFVPYNQIKNMPGQLQKEIDVSILATVEEQLPKPTIGNGNYKYYNSFRCPHCAAIFIDFENNRDIRPTEYYGNCFLNNELQHFDNR